MCTTLRLFCYWLVRPNGRKKPLGTNVFTGPDSHKSQCHHELQESHTRSANMRMKSCKILKSISQWEHAICPPPLPQKQLHLYCKNITKHTCHRNAGDFTTKHSLQDPQIHKHNCLITTHPHQFIQPRMKVLQDHQDSKNQYKTTASIESLLICISFLLDWVQTPTEWMQHTSITQLIETQQNTLQKTY